jgi:hypothetical protein
VIGVSLIVTIVVSTLLGIWLSTFDATTMDVFASQMAFTPDRFIDAIGAWGPAGITEFIRITATLDFVYPAAYAIAIGGLWARMAGPTAWTGTAWPLAAAFGAALADWLENLSHLAAAAAMVGGDRPNAALVAVGSAFATIKWFLLVGALIATAMAAGRRTGRARLVAIPVILIAGALAAAAVSASI